MAGEQRSFGPYYQDLKVICPKLIARHPEKFPHAKAKLTFVTKSEAKTSAKRNDVTRKQRPYLCRYCGYWHVGKTANVFNTEQQFIVPIRGNSSRPQVSNHLDPVSPLAQEINRLEFARFYPENSAQSDSIRKLIKDHSCHLALSDMMIFVVQPHLRAVVWVLQVLPNQPVFLKNGDEITFSRYVGEYWTNHQHK